MGEPFPMQPAPFKPWWISWVTLPWPWLPLHSPWSSAGSCPCPLYLDPGLAMVRCPDCLCSYFVFVLFVLLFFLSGTLPHFVLFSIICSTSFIAEFVENLFILFEASGSFIVMPSRDQRLEGISCEQDSPFTCRGEGLRSLEALRLKHKQFDFLSFFQFKKGL